MKTLTALLLTLTLNTTAFAGAKMSIYLEENGASKTVVFQCEDLTECAQRIQNRMETEGGCDSRVKKVEFETIYIPGFDDA